MPQRQLWYACALAGAVACAKAPEKPVAAAPTVDTAGVVQAVRTLSNAVNATEVAGSAADYAALYSETGRIDYPGFPPLIGRAAIEAAAKGFFAERDYSALTTTSAGTAVISNNLAFDGGAFAGSFVVKGKKPMTEHGRYISAAVKGADGQWRLSYLMAFPDSAVATK